MAFLDALNTSPQDTLVSTIYPEPGYIITIEPTLFKGIASTDGHQVEIMGFDSPVTLLTITVSGNTHIATLTFKDSTTLELDAIYVLECTSSNFLFEKLGQAQLSITLKNITSAYNNDSPFSALNTTNLYDISSPLVDLFQSGFLYSIAMFNPLNPSDNQPLFNGFIGDIDVSYDNNNIVIDLQIESYLQLLSRSACVQTQDQQNIGGVPIQSLTAQLLNFDDLLNLLVSNTIIAESLASIIYYKAPDEIEAINSNGSAVGTNTYMYIDTPFTDNRLNVILRALYPYQRVFYVDNAGNFIITPLQMYFDETENWTLGLDSGNIPLLNFKVFKKTGTIQNRSSLSFLQISQLYNLTTTTNAIDSASSVIAVATPNKNAGFDRLNDFVDSEEYLQTFMAVQELNDNLVQNSGLLNMALNLNNVTGLVNNSILVDDNLSIVKTNSNNNGDISYYLRLYSAKALAEQLFQETQLVVDIPLNLIFNQQTQTFRKIPLNECIYVPALNNNLLSGLMLYFCYGYEFSFSERGAMLKLYLTKPYTYTALWSPDKVDVLAISDFN